jgi:hypothetical protein
MHRLKELAAKLTPAEVKDVESYAEFLLNRRMAARAQKHEKPRDHKISFDGWVGCLAHVHPEMSDAEFKQFALDERVHEAMK